MYDQHLSQVLSQIVDPYYGIIRYIETLPLLPGEPPLHIVVTQFQHPYEVSPEGSKRRHIKMETQSAGAGLNLASAVWSAIGEAIERYAAGIYDPSRIDYAPSKSLKVGSYVNPHDFISFTEKQYAAHGFKYHMHDPEKPIGWIKASPLIAKEEVLFPAAMAYFGYFGDHPWENMSPIYSTGLACGASWEHAVSGGLYEVIERDAFALHWAAKLPPRRITIEQAMALSDDSLHYFLRFPGIGLTIGDMTTDIGVPSILVVARHPKMHGIALGASAHLCVKTALRKAVIECYHTINWCLGISRNTLPDSEKKVRSFQDHVAYFMRPGQHKKAAFLWETKEESDLSKFNIETPAPGIPELFTLKSKLLKLGHKAYVIDLTGSDVKSLGLRVARVVVPSLQPLWCGYENAPLDRRRFEGFLGYLGKDRSQPVNIQFHPFP